ncbi:MAG: CRTAC1 family protein [Verrucomicrobiota bacterium]
MKIGRVLIGLLVALALAKAGVEELDRERQQLNDTVWKQEVAAQEYERYFVELWDALRSDKGTIDVFAASKFGRLKLRETTPKNEYENGVQVSELGGAPLEFNHDAWIEWLRSMKERGYSLYQSEWHHGKFERDGEGHARSLVSIVLDVENKDRSSRYAIKGDLIVEWEDKGTTESVALPRSVDASGLKILRREGKPVFEEAIAMEIPAGRAGAVIAHDLDLDGLTDILLPNINTILWNLGERGYGGKPLHEVGIYRADTAVLGDFDGDGHPDLMIEGNGRLEVDGPLMGDGLYLYRGSRGGNFAAKPVFVDLPQNVHCEGAPCFTTGDVDGDGDLDLWIGQYKEMYLGGSMPTPYYDAKDGYPSYLLINQGKGDRFIDGTEAAGIVEKRNRRVFSSSFCDFDGDGDLDLLVVCDFAGVDLYLNDGYGKFEDVTATHFDNRHLFGMGHSIADFNGDGLLDIYAIGMSSTTARRLDRMNAERLDFPWHSKMRSAMGYGNRMYFGQPDGTLRQGESGPSYARSGWSWGVGSFDLENDGDLELYIANGHYSNESASDYCTHFWTDDIYRGSSLENPLLEEYFAKSVVNMISGGMSWNGFEHNALFAPMEDGSIRNVSFLMGVAIEEDSRQVVADDFDGDGRIDLLVTTYPPQFDKDRDPTTLRLLMNRSPQTGNWIGVRIAHLPEHPMPEGARIVLSYAGEKRIETVVTGDSHQSQHPTAKHFGLGDQESVDWIEVIWANGKRKRIENPAVNQYHAVKL